MICIGIDPGKSGGIAVLHDLGIVTAKMPETERDLLDLLAAWNVRSVAVIELVHAGVFGGKKTGKMGVSSAFSFGKGYGALLMALTAARIPFTQVSPVKWQTAMGCRTKGDKNVSKRRAQQLFPNVKCTHAISDALLMAEYCRRCQIG